MLKCRALIVVVVVFALVTGFSGRARGDGDEDALQRPERITVGARDQFLGELSPDETMLYFVSNRSTRKEIYAQDMEQGRARIAFDEGAEVAWPRVSRDGKEILYISFRDEATGQLCVRSVKDMADRRCLEGVQAATQAQWIDRSRIVLISRSSIHGDLRVSEVTVGSRLVARTLFERNWSSPTVSSDSRWIVYAPLDRAAKRIGPGFAARAAARLEAMRLDGKSAPVPLVIDLPGMTAQPAFSRDGRFLYFVQFFSDSNHDGVIDAADNGVLFRVPFPSAAEDAVAQTAGAQPLQLTESGLNCQYPAPAATRLITTCSHDGALDVYELPLFGEVPHGWSTDRLRAEAELATRHPQRLLLYRSVLAQEKGVTARRFLLMRLVMTHLELEEFDAAEFYAKALAELREPATRGIGRPMLLLVEHRRARTAEERGSSIEGSLDEAKKRLDRLHDDPKYSPAARILRHVVASEIADWMGDKSRAKEELDAAVVDDETPPSVIAMYHARADALYRELDDRDTLGAICRRLSRNQALSDDERIDYARAAVRALVRGLPYAEADSVLAREREAESGDTDFGFALELARAVLAIRSEKPGRELKARFTRLYEAQTRPERKRIIVLDAVERAADFGADSIVEVLAEHYVDEVAPGTEEHRRAMRVYSRALLGRAYRRLGRGRVAEARADFQAIMRRTESFEAIVETIELRLQAGERPEAIEAGLRASAEGVRVSAEGTRASAEGVRVSSEGPRASSEAAPEAGRPDVRAAHDRTPADRTTTAPRASAGKSGDHDPWSTSRAEDEHAACLAHFVRAYLDARELTHLTGDEHAKKVASARAHLRVCWAELKDKGPVRALQGTILHQEYLQTGSAEAIEKANSNYMVALELVRKSPRYQAVVLSKLGLLHTQTGNYRIALGYFRRREKLPYADPEAELAVRLAMARALLHVEREKEAADMAERALALVERVPALAPYRVLALDRAALCSLAADLFGRALALYDAEVPLLSTGNQPTERRNRLVVKLARAAAALGAKQPRRALEDLDAVELGLADRTIAPALAFPYATPDVSLRSYRSIAAGLRANAGQAVGQFEAAGLALERGRGLSEQRFSESNREDDARALTLIEAQLAANAVVRRDLSAAGKWIGRALDHADAAAARVSAGSVDQDQLHVLRLATELQVLGHAKVDGKIRTRVEDAQKRLALTRDSSNASNQNWFEIYLALTSGESQGRQSKAKPSEGVKNAR